MIPTGSSLLNVEFASNKQPSKNYKMHLEREIMNGYCDEQEAMVQVIYKILNTERYQYIIYSWNYGIELIDLYGEPVNYVCMELERRIPEALLQDDRITAVEEFYFDVSRKGVIVASFTVHTVFGGVRAEREVRI